LLTQIKSTVVFEQHLSETATGLTTELKIASIVDCEVDPELALTTGSG
jgi:hypothetical protein